MHQSVILILQNLQMSFHDDISPRKSFCNPVAIRFYLVNHKWKIKKYYGLWYYMNFIHVFCFSLQKCFSCVLDCVKQYN
jgi:hypothetical protein